MKTHRIFCLISAVLLSFGVGCVQTARDRGIIYESPDRLERVGLHDLLIVARLIDEKRMTVPRVNISAETFRSKDSGVTNSAGEVLLNVSLAEDEAVEFHFDGADFDATQTVSTVPAGVNKVTMIFILGDNRRVRLAALEF